MYIPNAPIAAAVIEDHPDFREGLTQLLENSEGFSSADSFSTVESALRGLGRKGATLPDVLLLDIHLPGTSGIEGIGRLKEVCPSARIIMVTVFDDDENIFNAILAGADGYLLKKTPPPQILQAISDAMDGGTPMSPFVARRVLEHFKSRPPVEQLPPASHGLSPRETEVLQALVQGFDTQGIADTMFISPETVRNHFKHIYEKLHVHSRSQAVAKAIKNRIV